MQKRIVFRAVELKHKTKFGHYIKKIFFRGLHWTEALRMVFYKKVFSTIHNFDSEATAFALEAMMASETIIVQFYFEITTK